jgi:hypothetical protein
LQKKGGGEGLWFDKHHAFNKAYAVCLVKHTLYASVIKQTPDKDGIRIWFDKHHALNKAYAVCLVKHTLYASVIKQTPDKDGIWFDKHHAFNKAYSACRAYLARPLLLNFSFSMKTRSGLFKRVVL